MQQRIDNVEVLIFKIDREVHCYLQAKRVKKAEAAKDYYAANHEKINVLRKCKRKVFKK